MPKASVDQLYAFERGPERIQDAINGLTELQLRQNPSFGGWSIHEIVIHLPDSEAIGYWRIRKTLAEADGLLPSYDESSWAQNLEYFRQDRAVALKLFAALRTATASLLRTLPAEAWERSSTHPEYGRVTVHDLFQIYLEHVNIHLQQINNIKQSFTYLA